MRTAVRQEGHNFQLDSVEVFNYYSINQSINLLFVSDMPITIKQHQCCFDISKMSKYRFDIDISYRIVLPSELQKYLIYCDDRHNINIKFLIHHLAEFSFIYLFIHFCLKKLQHQTNNEENPKTYLCTVT